MFIFMVAVALNVQIAEVSFTSSLGAMAPQIALRIHASNKWTDNFSSLGQTRLSTASPYYKSTELQLSDEVERLHALA